MNRKINIVVKCDFQSKVFENCLKNNIDQKFNPQISSSLFENLNISLIHNRFKNSNFEIFLSHIEKTFLTFKRLDETGKVNLKDLDKEINLFFKKLISFSKNNDFVIFFLWPLDTGDNYFGNLNFKKFGKNWFINYININLASIVSDTRNIILHDPNFSLLERESKIRVFDHKTKYLINNYFNIEYIEHLAAITGREIEQIYNKEKIKLIIIDLDNTIWGGEAGELEYDELDLGPNSVKGIVFQEFQQRLKLLKDNGILLAISSKNQIKNVKKVFLKNKNMRLKLKDFSARKVNWETKNSNIKEILKELNLKAENTLFIDDNRYEREIVKSDIDKINIFDFPKNLLDLNYNIKNYSGFRKNYISVTDKKRVLYYKQEKKRKETKKKFFNEKEWIKSLKIKTKIELLKNFDRAEEMFLRVNQFNTSHERLSKVKIKKYSLNNKKKIYQVSMSDKFGDYGIISIIALTFDKKNFYIEHFLMSCRVFERDVEKNILKFILNQKILKNKNGYIKINRIDKNRYVQDLFDKNNSFKKINNSKYKIK